MGDASDECADGGSGDAAPGSSVALSLRDAFQLMSQVLMSMQEAMLSIDVKSDQTEEVVHVVAANVRAQTRRLEVMESRLCVVEGRLRTRSVGADASKTKSVPALGVQDRRASDSGTPNVGVQVELDTLPPLQRSRSVEIQARKWLANSETCLPSLKIPKLVADTCVQVATTSSSPLEKPRTPSSLSLAGFNISSPRLSAATVGPLSPSSSRSSSPSSQSSSAPSSFSAVRSTPPPRALPVSLRRTASCSGGSKVTTVSSLSVSRARPALGRSLLKAAQDGRTAEVRKLLNKGADANFPNGSKWTPLHKAAMKAHAGVVSLLLGRGADVKARTSYGFTPLHLAAYGDRSGRCATLLIDAGSDIESKNQFGRTPLHYAAECSNESAMQVLVKAGASKKTKDDDGKTPYDVVKLDSIRPLLRPQWDGRCITHHLN